MPVVRPFKPVFRWPRDHYSTPGQDPITHTNNGWGPIYPKPRYDPYYVPSGTDMGSFEWPPSAKSGIKKPG